MITFKAIVIPNNRRKDGTYPVKIRVTFKGVTRRLPTTLVCTTNDLTRSLKIKNATILSKADELIARMRDAVKDVSPFDLYNKDVDWVVQTIKNELTKCTFHLNYFDWADDYIRTKNETTQYAYWTALNAFERFLGSRYIDINDITRPLLQNFMSAINKENKIHWNNGKMSEGSKQRLNNGASSRYLSKLALIFNEAKNKYNDEDSDIILIPKSPFSKIVKDNPPAQGQKSIGQELMQKVIADNPSNRVERFALDVFILSFGLMGANLADLYSAKPVIGNTWIYYRQKTRGRRADKAEMRVVIPDEIRPYIERLKGTDSNWWLGELHRSDNKNHITAAVNRGLKKWCARNGLPPFTLYAARHTWATLARKAGVEKATIDECLCHIGDFNVTDIYAERSWELLAKANRVVLNLFKWDCAVK